MEATTSSRLDSHSGSVRTRPLSHLPHSLSQLLHRACDQQGVGEGGWGGGWGGHSLSQLLHRAWCWVQTRGVGLGDGVAARGVGRAAPASAASPT